MCYNLHYGIFHEMQRHKRLFDDQDDEFEELRSIHLFAILRSSCEAVIEVVLDEF